MIWRTRKNFRIFLRMRVIRNLPQRKVKMEEIRQDREVEASS